MIPIYKNEEPEALAYLRSRCEEDGLSPVQSYARLKGRTKAAVRRSLLKEQGHLCAYCMCRIPREDTEEGIPETSIEHIDPRSPEDHHDEKQGLDYQNMVLACDGNRELHGKKRLHDLTCDAHKGNDLFRKINPVKPETLKGIYYHTNGEIHGADEDTEYDLNVILNLNAHSSPLPEERKAALQELTNVLGTYPDELLADGCRQMLRSLEEEDDPKTPYQGILQWYLRALLNEIA